MRKLREQADFRFKIVLKSPLLIASIDSAAINVGGVDSIMATNPVTGEPVIPPSSLYGKIRYLYYITRKDTDKEADYYFGSAQAEKPSIINIKSIELVPANTEGFTLKAENTISRLNLEAKPRLLQSAHRGLEFICTMLVNLYDSHSEISEDVIQEVIIPSLIALEDNYLGGCGTRGFGEIEIFIQDGGGNWISIHDAKNIPIAIPNATLKTETIEIEDGNSPLKEEIIYLHTPLFSDSRIQSATLAGLFAYALSDMGKESLIEHIYNGEDFFISSAFPCIEIDDGKRIHFFPRPLIYVEGIKTHNKNRKAFCQ